MILDILLFLRNPFLFSNKNKNAKIPKARTIIKSFLLSILFLIISVFAITIVELLTKNFFSFSIKRNIDINRNQSHEYWGVYRSLISVLFAPIIEEIVFRLPLTSKKRWFIFSISFGVFFFISDSVYFISEYNIKNISLAITTFIILNILFNKKETIETTPIYYNIWCYLLIVSFSWMHISNFSPIKWEYIYLYPIYVLPQLFYGIILSYLMAKYKNILWPILVHIMINFLGFVINKIY